ncbi:MAG: LamG domain-containing protein [Bacteroidota bacterium]
MKTSKTYFAQRCLTLLSILILGTANALCAQTTWTGSLGTAWNDASNWSAGIPDASDAVTIPNVANKPALSTPGVAKSINVNSGSTFTITLSGALALNGGDSYGIYNSGTVNNGGTIHIGNISAAGYDGIRNLGTFNNQGTINIDRTSRGIAVNFTRTFNNEGTIVIGANSTLPFEGIYLEGNLNNKPGGLIKIDRIDNDAIYNAAAGTNTTNNQGTITIGSSGSIAKHGISNNSFFNNLPGGIINIDRTAQSGIYLAYRTFPNQGTINIGSKVPVTDLITLNSSQASFDNNYGGILKGTGNLQAINNGAGTLSPGYSPGIMTFTSDETFGEGTIAMEVNGTGTPGVNFDQIVVNGKATLEGTLALSINYAGANGHQIPILTADEVTDSFEAVTGLLPNWYVNYTSTAVYLVYCTSAFSFYPVTGSGLYNCGGIGRPVGITDSQVGVNYQLKKDGINAGSPKAGTGLAISFGNQTKGVYTVMATYASGGCAAIMPGSAEIVENCTYAALDFDGTDDNVKLPNALATAMSADTALTIEYWFKGTNLTSAVRCQTGGAYIMSGFNGKHIISTDGGSAGVAVGAAATNGNWHHLAMTWKKNTVNGFKSYLDGVLVEQRNSANVNLPVLTSGLYLGANAGTAEFMDGSLDEVRIWEVARTPCEIQSSWQCELGPDRTGLLAYYKSNQGIVGESNTGVTTLIDSSGNNYTGTLNNFALTGTASTWVSPGGVAIGNPCTGTSTWLGISAAWATPGNWSTGFVPAECTRVIINSGVPFKPIVSGLNNSCLSVKLNSGAQVNIGAGAKLNITGK